MVINFIFFVSMIFLTKVPYSALISLNLNFADSRLQSFRWINFAAPARYGRALVGVGNFRWIIFAEPVVFAKTAKIKSHEIQVLYGNVHVPPP